jgi:hypothetical protein
MTFTPKPKQPEFASLKGILAQSKAKKDDALYKTVQYLIERMTRFQTAINGDVIDVNASVNTVNSAVNVTADKTRTYLTSENEALNLPNSRKLIAGTGIVFNDLIANQRTISTVSLGDHVPMATGAEPLEIMSDGAGHVFLVAFNV